MFGDLFRNIVRLVIVLLLQGLIFNHWHLGWGVQPFFYVLFVLMLPFETPPMMVLFLGFLCGLGMDAFDNTLGMHSSALTLLAYLRGPLLERISPRDGYETGMKPVIRDLGAGWYLRYAGPLVLGHHAWLFGLEFFRLDELHLVLGKATLSALFTLTLLFIHQYLIHGASSRGR